jgi:hypothetical protein
MMRTASSLLRIAGVGQFLLDILDLALLQHFHAVERVLHLVRGVGIAHQLLALLRVVGDDPRLEFVAALVERLDAPGHRIPDRHRGVDREDHGKAAIPARIEPTMMTSKPRRVGPAGVFIVLSVP